jgi:hypothetical protein
MKQYLLSVHYVEGQPATPPEVMEQAFRDVDALNKKMMETGTWVFGCGLHEPSTATVVQMQGDDFLITDGPFPEAKEQLGGFWVIKAPDLDAALDWARQATVACKGPVEVRPLQDESED